MNKKIFVILPSLNEGKNIMSITKIVDQGLSEYFLDYDNCIVNVDSNSKDLTVERFKSVEVNSKKVALQCGKSGKGRAIKYGLEYAIKNNASYILMLDSDLISAKPIWIKKFIDQLIQGKDFVVPIYARNKYEGNTTNHLISPLFYACLGIDMQQPIAGDFGISKKLAMQVVNSFEIKENYNYGIDCLVSFNAIFYNYRIAYIKLNNKIHNPSFPKIQNTFFDACISVFYLINKNREGINEAIRTNNYDNLSKDLAFDKKFVSKPSLKSVHKLQNETIELIVYMGKSEIIKDYEKIKKINKEVWTEIISEYVSSILLNDYSYKNMVLFSREILPLFYLRVIDYFKEIENLSIYEIQDLISEQKIEIKNKISNKTI